MQARAGNYQVPYSTVTSASRRPVATDYPWPGDYLRSQADGGDLPELVDATDDEGEYDEDQHAGSAVITPDEVSHRAQVRR